MNQGNASECIILGALTWMPHMIADGEFFNPVVSGTMLEALDIFANQLNFCYNFTMKEDRAGGDRLENGTWTGLMSLVVQEKIEFTGLGLAINHDRFQDADLSEYLYFDEWNAGYIRPKLQSDIAGFVKPYTFRVWLFVMIAMMAMWSVSYHVLTIPSKASRPERSYDRHQIELKNSESAMTAKSYLYESGAWTFGTLFAQSLPDLPRSDSERILTGLWLLTSLILATVYRSNLKAMLILPKVYLPFDNLQELAKTDIPMWVPTDSYFHSVSKVSPSNTTMGEILKQFVGVDAPTDVPWGISAMHAGELALASPLSGLLKVMDNTFSQTGKCVTYVMSEGYLKTIQCFILPKGSPWKKQLDPVIIQLRESGILDYIYLKGVRNATECLKPITSQGDTKLRPMDLGDFYGVFFIYSGGILAVLVIFIGELMTGHRKQVMRHHPVTQEIVDKVTKD